MLVLKGDGSQIDIDGYPYDLDFENNVDKFCEQYLNDTSSSFEEKKAFFCAEIKHQYHKSSSSKNPHAENKFFTLEQDHVNDEPFSCDSSLPSSTSSTIHTSPKDSKSLQSSTNPSSKKGTNSFHVVFYSYHLMTKIKLTFTCYKYFQ